MAKGQDLLLGLDIGTTATKALLFDLEGRPVATATMAYGLTTPRPGWVEQDPEALWQAVIAAVREVVGRQPRATRILALSLASQGGTTIPLDAAKAPTCNAISWMDERGTAQAARIRETMNPDEIYTTTGWPHGNTLPLKHIAWLRDERPDVFARTVSIRFVNDFVVERLTGVAVMNPSDASITQLFNIATVDWDERLLELAGITRHQVAPVWPSGRAVGSLTAEASRITGLPPGTMVINGAHDQYCAAVGTGVTRPGTVLLSCGTAWVILAVPEDLEGGLASGMAISCHAVSGRWGAIRSLGGVGASLEWFLNQIWCPSDTAARAEAYTALNDAAAQAPAGARGLLFYPLAGGHGLTDNGRGGMMNLALDHTRGDMARAVMEGISFELRWALDEITARGVPVECLTMVGGAAESPLWPRIVADSTGLPVNLPSITQAAARGAAILAGVGAGVFPDAESGFGALKGQETRLVPGTNQTYDALFARYRALHDAVTRVSTQNQGEILA